jgi:cyclophilin family peptidyl-prolyl cis-trans isomerase
MTLCERGYFNNTNFHRLIPGFMIQGGDPSGDGTGGESAFHRSFKDEFDSRLVHDRRGIVSMANSGPNTNNSQFFITFASTSHLDLVHSVFGRVVGGNATLDRIEAIGSDKLEKPKSEIKITQTQIISNPIPEADTLLTELLCKTIEDRKNSVVKTLLGKRDNSALAVSTEKSTEPKASSLAKVIMPQLAPVDQEKRKADSNFRDSDKIAAFMKSQGTYSDVGGGDAVAVAKKQKTIGGDFSSW